MNALTYLLQVNLYLLLFYLFYLVLLRNETFFKMNRFYLVGSALFSMIIPAMKADWIKELFITEKVQQLTHSVTYAVVRPQIELLNVTTLASPDQPWLSTMEWLWLIYAVVSLIFLINFLRKLYQVNSTFKIKLKGRAFSFFGKIVVDEELEGKDIIIKHELVHARQWHSADVVFFEIFLAMNWFNPIVYLYRNAIKNIHEFIADDSAASTLEERSAYALLLVSSVFNTQPQRLTNNFFNQSLLKRRIIMLHKTKSRKVAILKYGLSVPLFAGMLIFSSATGADAKVIKSITRAIPEPVIIPAQLTKAAKMDELEIPVKKKIPQIDSTGEAKYQPEVPKNLYDFATSAFENSLSAMPPKTGMVYYSFDVNDNQKIVEFRITRSIGSDWEKKSLSHLNSFNEKVNLKQGTYNFYQFYGYGFYDKSLSEPDENTPFLFGNTKSISLAVLTFDETKEAAGSMVNYIMGAPEGVVVLFNDKEIETQATPRGLRLSKYYDPADTEKFAIYQGDEAVKFYNESARPGLVVILTKEYIKSKQK